MKKLLYLYFSLVLLTLQINAQKADFSFESLRYGETEPPLFGKVRTLLTSSYSSDDITETVVESFDLQKKKKEFISHSADIEVHSREMVSSTTKQVYIYNSKNGKLEGILSYDEKDDLWGRTKLIYNSNGLLQEENLYSYKNELIKKTSYTYDRQKMEVTRNLTSYFKNSSGIVGSVNSRSITQFDKSGQLIKRVRFNLDGEQWDSVIFEYDEKGVLVKEDSCCDFNYSKTFDYKFDVHGNWIERIEFLARKGEGGKIDYYESGKRIYRTITYYSDKFY